VNIQPPLFQSLLEKYYLKYYCLISFVRLEKIEFGYWPFVKELTHSETVKHIVNHPQVTTDLDKGM